MEEMSVKEEMEEMYVKEEEQEVSWYGEGVSG